MRSCARMLLTLSFLVIPFGAYGQESAKPQKSDVLARLSYRSSAVVVQREGVSQVCVAISREGEYRMIRQTSNRPIQRVHGTLSKEQFEQVSKLLDSPKFQALSGNHGGLIRQDAESFTAEIPVAITPQTKEKDEDGGMIFVPNETQHSRRLHWLNADGENPFPDSVLKIIGWMRSFQPKDAKEFEYAEFPDVCPSGELRLIQPTVADNQRP